MAGTALVVEDHPLYRDALTLLLKGVFGEAGVVAASSAEEGLRIAEASPDLALVLLDPGLPGMKGVEAVSAFRRRWPDIAVITISASEDRRDAAEALRAGAVAFVSKAASTDVVSDLVRRVRARPRPVRRPRYRSYRASSPSGRWRRYAERRIRWRCGCPRSG